MKRVEPGRLNVTGICAGIDQVEQIQARLAGLPDHPDPGIDVQEGHRRACDHRLAFVSDHALDAPSVILRHAAGGEDQKQRNRPLPCGRKPTLHKDPFPVRRRTVQPRGRKSHPFSRPQSTLWTCQKLTPYLPGVFGTNPARLSGCISKTCWRQRPTPVRLCNCLADGCAAAGCRRRYALPQAVFASTIEYSG